MTSVILLNICGYMLSVSFGPVARQAAEYYDVSGDMIDMFPLVVNFGWMQRLYDHFINFLSTFYQLLFTN